MMTMPGMMTPEQMTQQWSDYVSKVFALPGVVDTMRNTRVGVTPSRVVHREDQLKLLEYETDVPRQFDTPLLLIFALVNRPYILDLKDGKSVIKHFVDAGFPTFNIDWGKPTHADKDLTIEHYVLTYIDHVVDRIREQTGQDKINILGYCMGGSLSVMYASLRPEKIKNLILLAAPVDWSHEDNLLVKWTSEKYFDVDKLIDTYGNAPAEYLQMSFQMLKPVQNMIQKHFTLQEKLDDKKFLEDFFAMETWLNDNIPVAGEVFRQFVKDCFQRNLLIQNKLHLGQHRVDLSNIKCPVLNLVAEHDHLVLPDQSTPLEGAIGSKDYELINSPVGHIGLAVSSKAHRNLWPGVVEWLGKRSDATK